mmetsp:Transcript_19583/g.30679  ORF Transcript_19583/g.30679 Transcript_19583/m.30679 type:complete len:306 (+) Transcript_19583:237-1154(+)|eukprot:CAMPEP_0184296396 /NCGR_PEP_ID=MMETSP1049-20130417/7375_1 /TAXON_ID=77928 /ORGANISM="Proteomonas sulcata, Strain CCMP704" /LENGTH=305 /DNA_ID=CAMNT_0026605611 /DNA_START=135 /DNA_END=1052 /DNA_ORIENTATION=+
MHAKLSVEQVLEIYSHRPLGGVRQSALAGRSTELSKIYHVSPKAIRDIWNRTAWNHLTEPDKVGEHHGAANQDSAAVSSPGSSEGSPSPVNNEEGKDLSVPAVRRKPGRPPGSKDAMPRKRRRQSKRAEDENQAPGDAHQDSFETNKRQRSMLGGDALGTINTSLPISSAMGVAASHQRPCTSTSSVALKHQALLQSIVDKLTAPRTQTQYHAQLSPPTGPALPSLIAQSLVNNNNNLSSLMTLPVVDTTLAASLLSKFNTCPSQTTHYGAAPLSAGRFLPVSQHMHMLPNMSLLGAKMGSRTQS